MSSLTDILTKKSLIRPPGFMDSNVHYEVMMGSVAYGCNTDMSDIDVYGFCIPPKDIIFPHLRGVVQGFDKQVKRFEQFQIHHVKDISSNTEYDLSIYNIVKYFRLVADNNPNMVDSLFVPRRCVLHSTKIGEMVRDNRHIFLSKKSWHSFKGYAYSQLHKMKGKAILTFVTFCKNNNLSTDITKDDVDKLSLTDEKKNELSRILKQVDTNNRTKRLDSIVKYGYDIKFAYHVIRLLNEVEQILEEQDLDLTRHREQLKSIRRGEWTLEQVEDHFYRREKELECAYKNSTLRYTPDEVAIKSLLLNCLEEHFGTLEKAIVTDNQIVDAMRQIQDLSNNALRFIK